MENNQQNGILSKYLNLVIYLAVIINLVTIIFSLLLDIGVSFLGNITGIFLLVAWSVNLLTVFFYFGNLNRADEKGNLLKNLCYLFLFFFFFALILLIMKLVMLMPLMLYLSFLAYYGILGFGLLFAILGYRLRDRAETWVK